VDGLLSAHAASLHRSGFLRITDRVDEIAARFDTLIATGELDALFFGADTPSVATSREKAMALVSFTASVRESFR
jgi:hypothetical protein